MDVKAISWVGNIYQKFEAMCLEVEEVMYQDTIDYVENQVQTVGASVKKFYSEIMQDLHPESYIDPVKVAAADLSLNPYAHNENEKKAKASLKENQRGIDMKFAEDTQVIKGKSRLGGIYRRQNVGIRKNTKDNHIPLKTPFPSTPMSLVIKRDSGCEMESDHLDATSRLASAKGCAFRDTVEEICDHKSDTDMHTTGSTIDNAVSDMTLLAESAGQKQEDSASTSSGSSGITGVCTISNGSAERSENHDSDVLKAYDVLEQEVEVVDRDAKSRLEETCVLVEGDELLVPRDPIKLKSYKKKICDAFSSKTRLTRKEYEKLATRYENQPLNEESEEKAAPALRLKGTTEISACEFPDSEWEFL